MVHLLPFTLLGMPCHSTDLLRAVRLRIIHLPGIDLSPYSSFRVIER